jgi:hypothetical protein
MPATLERPIALFHEHPDWFRPLFTVLERRGTPFVRIAAAQHGYDPGEAPPYSLVFNRMSPSAYLGGCSGEAGKVNAAAPPLPVPGDSGPAYFWGVAWPPGRVSLSAGLRHATPHCSFHLSRDTSEH